MNYKVVVKEEASLDFIDAYTWHESCQVGLGTDFIEEFEQYVKILESNPQIYQIRKNNLRHCPLKRFPYIVVFELEKQEVIVYAVFNSYQHPNR